MPSSASNNNNNGSNNFIKHGMSVQSHSAAHIPSSSTYGSALPITSAHTHQSSINNNNIVPTPLSQVNIKLVINLIFHIYVQSHITYILSLTYLSQLFHILRYNTTASAHAHDTAPTAAIRASSDRSKIPSSHAEKFFCRKFLVSTICTYEPDFCFSKAAITVQNKFFCNEFWMKKLPIQIYFTYYLMRLISFLFIGF